MRDEVLKYRKGLGTQRDFTRSNAQSGAAFLPFGAEPAPGDRLVLRCESALVAKS